MTTPDDSMVSTPLLVTVPHAAHLLSVGASTVWRLIGRGEVPVVRINGSTRLRLDDVRRLAGERAG